MVDTKHLTVGESDMYSVSLLHWFGLRERETCGSQGVRPHVEAFGMQRPLNFVKPELHSAARFIMI